MTHASSSWLRQPIDIFVANDYVILPALSIKSFTTSGYLFSAAKKRGVRIELVLLARVNVILRERKQSAGTCNCLRRHILGTKAGIWV